MVTTKSGESFVGILYSFDKAAVVLRQAEAVGAADDKTNLPLDGEVILLLPDIDFMQRPTT